MVDDALVGSATILTVLGVTTCCRRAIRPCESVRNDLIYRPGAPISCSRCDCHVEACRQSDISRDFHFDSEAKQKVEQAGVHTRRHRRSVTQMQKFFIDYLENRNIRKRRVVDSAGSSA